MKNVLLFIVLVIITITSFAQRSVRVRELVDTTNIRFKEISQFWENYQNVLQAKIFGMEVDIKPYWADSYFRCETLEWINEASLCPDTVYLDSVKI